VRCGHSYKPKLRSDSARNYVHAYSHRSQLPLRMQAAMLPSPWRGSAVGCAALRFADKVHH
jgi:hypothetical protein